MTFALQWPELASNVVSVDNAPIDAALLSMFGKYVQGMKKIEDAKVTKQLEADNILADYEEVSQARPLRIVLILCKNPVIRQFLLSNLYRPEGTKNQKFRVPLDILGRSLDNLGDFPFKDPEITRYLKPTLFVRGTQSHYIPDEAIPVIGRFFPKFEIADIDAGHWVISEKPEAFRQGTYCNL